MSASSGRHKTVIQRRIDYLLKKIDERGEEPSNYYKQEVAAFRWALAQIENEETNVYQHRAYEAGQTTLLKHYKKALGNALHSGNLGAMQHLYDLTVEWLDQKTAIKGE